MTRSAVWATAAARAAGSIGSVPANSAGITAPSTRLASPSRAKGASGAGPRTAR
ncbi:hypothetical protein [Rugamonas sp. DEMB1]|uniref:hypothetical protein n=1 Tax=Rugamonas sp. DEMB1 TaxID=3039386 RepID=UPI0028BF0602|nr:hypothetical protein [Rugamonas sp. DEMB1]